MLLSQASECLLQTDFLYRLVLVYVDMQNIYKKGSLMEGTNNDNVNDSQAVADSSSKKTKCFTFCLAPHIDVQWVKNLM